MMMSYSDSAARSTANSVGILHFAASALRLDVTRCTSSQNDVTERLQEVGREGSMDIADPSARSRACDSPVVHMPSWAIGSMPPRAIGGVRCSCATTSRDRRT